MTTPTWAPSLSAVADYVTSRTVDSSTPGSDTPAGTFTPGTYPTAEQVQRLIDSSSRWLLTAVGTLAADLEADAGDIVAMRTAGLVELSYPERDGDISSVGQALLDESKASLALLTSRNILAGGTGVRTTGTPLGNFPDPSSWRGDDPVRWR